QRLDLRQSAFLFFAFLEGFAMPAVLIFGKRYAFAFFGRRDDCKRFIGGSECMIESGDNLPHIVTINGDSLKPEGFKAAAVNFRIVTVHGALALSESIDINDGSQIIEIVVRGNLR